MDQGFSEIRDQQRLDAHRNEAPTRAPSAEYLKARIQFLTKILLTQFREILETAASPDDESTSKNAPTLAETQNQILTANAATQQMVRASEELMVLTRTMKELWLFGGLDTLEVEGGKDGEKAEKEKEEEDMVVRGMGEWIERNSHLLKDRTDAGDVAMGGD